MSDGKIEYELSIEAQKAIRSVDAVSQATDGLANSAARAANAAGNINSAFDKISSEKLKAAAAVALSIGSDLASIGLKETGHERAARYVESIGTNVAAGAASGGMVGSVIPGVGTGLGAAIGAAAGAVKGFYKEHTREGEAAAQLTESARKSMEMTRISAEAFRRSLTDISLDQLEKTIKNIKEELLVVSEKAKVKLIDKDTAAGQLSELKKTLDYAEKMIPGLEQKDREEAAKKGNKNPDRAADGTVSVDSFTASGAIFAGMSSAANDHARSTAQNTSRMVQLLEQISRTGTGGSTWQQ